MKKMSIALAKRGHMAIFISQVRSDIKLDPYAANKDIRQTTATGGNALLHFANWILEFEPRFNKDLILEKPNEKYDPVKNKIIGHTAKLIIKKSTVGDDLIKELKDAGLELSKQHQGMDNFRKYLEENPKITDYLFDKYKKLIPS
jgi:RecA/RadA recombinase